MMIYDGENWWYGFGMMLIPAILIIAFFFFMFYSLNKNNNHSHNHKHEKDAFHILKERYARGEISEEEYERMKKTLKD